MAVKLLAPPKQNTEFAQRPAFKLIVRLVFGVGFLVLGFNFAGTAFFQQYPLFGVDYLAEVLISLIAALFGFFTVPRLLLLGVEWLEKTIDKTVYAVVSEFWERQTQRRNEAQRLKDQERKEKRLQEILNGVLVDTSVLIDGRITDIVKLGFINRTLIILKDVIKELQQVADSKDRLKRQRGRRGLDVLKKLGKYAKIVVIENDRPQAEKDVDHILVNFARTNNLKLLTLDFNLIKVAEVAKVKVLNINMLVEALKTVLLPGEEINVKIVQQGREKRQGIGYLEDGTMIVVEDAKELVGTQVKACVSKIIQSSAGKMIFCSLLNS